MDRIAWIAGSTGLIGGQLLARLLDSTEYSHVIAPGRRIPRLTHRKLIPLVGGLSPDALRSVAQPLDAFCCLGTTLQAAGSREGFEEVDHQLVLMFARAARAAQAERFLVVSSVGASPRALSYYLRVKGRMERDVAALGFRTTHFLRPSLLLGQRRQSRPLEHLAQRLLPALAPLLVGGLRKYRPVTASAVADAMIRLAQAQALGVNCHDLPLLPSA